MYRKLTCPPSNVIPCHNVPLSSQINQDDLWCIKSKWSFFFYKISIFNQTILCHTFTKHIRNLVYSPNDSIKVHVIHYLRLSTMLKINRMKWKLNIIYVVYFYNLRDEFSRDCSLFHGKNWHFRTLCDKFRDSSIVHTFKLLD